MATSRRDELRRQIAALDFKFDEVEGVYPALANRIAFERDRLLFELQQEERNAGIRINGRGPGAGPSEPGVEKNEF